MWFDRECMPSRSLTFLQEIRDEINRTQQLILIVGPGTLRSEYVRAEWHHALAEAKVVIPILRDGEFEDLPLELNQFHCVDARKKRNENDFYAEIKRILKEPIPPLAMVFGKVPDLPPHFQPRPDETSVISGTTFWDLEKPVDLKPSEKLILIYGMGGVGKTTLSAAFARSTATRRVFNAGIYWLSATPELGDLAICNRLGQIISGSPQDWKDVTEGTAKLKEWLTGKRCLIVLDNIWNIEQVECLLGCLDLNTRVLMTSRDGGLVAATGARGINILDLSKTSALTLLADWMGKMPEELPPIAEELAKECGYLPFALAVNGAMLAEGISFEALLDELRNAQIDFAEKRFANYGYPTVLKSLKVSTDMLAKADKQAYDHFCELAVFNWEAGVSQTAVAQLLNYSSGLSAAATAKLLNTLKNKSLIRLTQSSSGYNIFLHDLMIDFLLLTTDNHAALNKKLLASYRKLSDPDWPNGPIDGYFHHNLTIHLLKDNQVDEVHRLFSIETKDGLNAWYASNEATDNIAGYLDDLDRITHNAKAELKDQPSIARYLKWQVHYGLIKASLRSLAATLPREICVALLRTGIWNESRAVAEACQIEEKVNRFNAFLELMPFLKEPFLSKVKVDALGLAHEYHGNDDNLLARFISFLADGELKDQICSEAITFAKNIRLAGYRAKAFAIIIDVLPENKQSELMGRALEFLEEEIVTAGINQGGFESVRQLAPHVNSNEMLRLIDLVRKIPEQFSKASSFAAILPYVNRDIKESLAREALAEQARIEGNALWIYLSIKRHLPDTSFDELFDEIILTDMRQVSYLISLLPKDLPDIEIEKWMEKIRTTLIDNEYNRIEAYLALLPYLPSHRQEALVQQLCNEIPKLEFDTWRENAYRKLAPHLNAEQLINAKAVLLNIGDRNDIAYAFLTLFDYLDEDEKKQLNEFFLSSVNISRYLDLYIGLAKKSAPAEKQLLLQKAYEALQQGASMTGGTMMGTIREETLSDFASMAPMEWRPIILNTALDWAFKYGGAEKSAEKFCILIKHLTPDIIEKGSVQILNLAFNEAETRTVQTISGTVTGDSRIISNTIGTLAPHLNEPLIGQLINLVREIPDEGSKFIALIHLAPYMKEEQKEQLLGEAYLVQKQLPLNISEPGKTFCDGLLLLSDMLQDGEKKEVLQNALIAAITISAPWRCYRLIKLAERFAPTERAFILEAALQLAKPWDILKIWKLMPSGEIPTNVVDNIIDDVKYWGWTLASILPYYIEKTDKQTQYQLWKKLQPALLSLNRKEMSQRLANSSSLLSALGGQKIINEMNRSLLKVCQWWK